MSKHTKGRILLSAALCAGVSWIALSTGVQAQGTLQDAVAAEDDSTVVVVRGVRGSQLRSVDIKKRTLASVDAISSEDIGKLPDTTIADSLQRVPGVQIRRDAGEGSTVNLRGLAQTITLFNGEQYLSAGNIGQAQANMLDVPSQLMSSVVVYKTTDPKLPLAGISGTIDLKTRRPFQFGSGLTLTGAVEKSQGDYTKSEEDYLANGLISWRNDRFGVLLSVSSSQSNLGANYSGFGGGVFSQNDWGAGMPMDYIAPHGFEVYNRAYERKRFGASGAFELKIDDGYTLTGEVFHTRLTEHNRATGLNISNRWDGGAFATWLTPTDYEATGETDADGRPWWNVSEYDIDAHWLNSFSVNRTNTSESTNVNLELKYDNGGNFTYELRMIGAHAERLSMNGQAQGDLSNWRYDADGRFSLFRNANDRTRGTFYPAAIAAQYAGQYSNSVVGANGGRYVDPNPLGYGVNPQLHVNFSGSSPVFSGFGDVMQRAGGLGAGKTTADYMANKNAYAIGAFSSEGNNDAESDLSVFRYDGHYRFDSKLFGVVTKLDGGIRASQRKVQIEQFHLFSRFYAGTGASDPQGCLAQWKAIDVVMDQVGCTAGEMVPDPVTGQPVFQGYTVNRPTKLDTYNNVLWVDDVGGDVSSGIPGFWAIDPRDFDDIVAFQTKVFGGAQRVIVPGQSYDVKLNEASAYGAGEFEAGIFRGNFGVHVIETKLWVRQNLTGATMPYGDTNADAGDTFSVRKYTDVLPSFNVIADVSDTLRVRFGASRVMQPLDLGNYGGALSIATNDDPANNRRVVTSASSSGNPNLDPWRANVVDLGVEYYLGRASMVNVSVFRLDIESFVTSGQILSTPGQFTNSDGSPAGAVPIFLPIQGRGGQVEGVEIAGKFAFSDFDMPGLLSNFGVEANYTYSPSEGGQKGLNGDALPFVDNSKHQFNLVGWYQDEHLQVRVAYNYRSERLNNVLGLTAGSNIPVFADPTSYLDVNATWNLSDRVSLYVNGSNVTGEIETYKYRFNDDHEQFAFQNQFEPRYTVGVRARW